MPLVRINCGIRVAHAVAANRLLGCVFFLTGMLTGLRMQPAPHHTPTLCSFAGSHPASPHGTSSLPSLCLWPLLPAAAAALRLRSRWHLRQWPTTWPALDHSAWQPRHTMTSVVPGTCGPAWGSAWRATARLCCRSCNRPAAAAAPRQLKRQSSRGASGSAAQGVSTTPPHTAPTMATTGPHPAPR